jgi:hypothetical protein
MKTLKTLIILLNGLVIVLGYIFAAMYLFRPEFMSYHSVAVHQTWSQVDTQIQVLILALMRVSGGGWLGVSVAMSILLGRYYRTERFWLIVAIFFTGIAILLPTLYATLFVKSHSEANPPWIAALVAVAILLIALVLSKIRSNLMKRKA